MAPTPSGMRGQARRPAATRRASRRPRPPRRPPRVTLCTAAVWGAGGRPPPPRDTPRRFHHPSAAATCKSPVGSGGCRAAPLPLPLVSAVASWRCGGFGAALAVGSAHTSPPFSAPSFPHAAPLLRRPRPRPSTPPPPRRRRRSMATASCRRPPAAVSYPAFHCCCRPSSASAVPLAAAPTTSTTAATRLTAPDDTAGRPSPLARRASVGAGGA